jgi:hypothetical protein
MFIKHGFACEGTCFLARMCAMLTPLSDQLRWALNISRVLVSSTRSVCCSESFVTPRRDPSLWPRLHLGQFFFPPLSLYPPLVVGGRAGNQGRSEPDGGLMTALKEEGVRHVHGAFDTDVMADVISQRSAPPWPVTKLFRNLLVHRRKLG